MVYMINMMLLVVLKTLRNTFPTNVSLLIMESYLLMLKVFIVTMISNKLKNLLLLRVLMKLLLWLKRMMLLFTNLKILPYLNIAMRIMLLMLMLNYILRTTPLSKKRLIFCRSLWKKKLMKLWAHWMKKMMRRAKNKRRKRGLATHAHLLMGVTLQLIYCLISLRAYQRMIAMMIVMIPLILLKYPFLMMLAMLVAKMPIWIMLMEMNLL